MYSRVSAASCSPILLMANPTWIRTQSPTFDGAGVAGDQADVDLAAHTVDVDDGSVLGQVDDLDQLAGDA